MMTFRSHLLAKVFLGSFAFLLLLSSCATLLREKDAELSLNSSTEKVKVYVNGSFIGETPLKVKLSTKRDYSIRFVHPDGRERVYDTIRSVSAGWIILDVLVGFWPIVIDFATASWYQFTDDTVKMDF